MPDCSIELSERENRAIDPRAFGLTRAAYGVVETLDLLSIGRTSACMQP